MKIRIGIYFGFLFGILFAIAQERIFVHTDRDGYLAGEMIWCKVYVLDDKGGVSFLSKVAYIEILDLENKPVAQVPVFLENGMGHTYIHLSTSLKTSGYVLRCYTNWLKNYGEKSFFTKNVSIINPTVAYKNPKLVDNDSSSIISSDLIKIDDNSTILKSPHISIEATLSKHLFKCREEVNISIATLLNEELRPANLSISVAKIDSLGKYFNPHMIDYLSKEKNSRWVGGDRPELPEYEGMITSGYLKSCEGKALPNHSIQVFDKSRSSLFLTTKTDQSGFFYFILEQPLSTVYLMVENDKSCYSFEFKSNFSNNYFSREIGEFTLSEKDLSALESRYVHMQLEVMNFSSFRKEQGREPFTNLFTQDFIEYKLDDYTRFKSLEETIREYISELSIRRIDDRKGVRLLNTKSNSYFESSPLIFLDGVPINDSELLWDIPADRIEYIRLITSPYVLGERVFQGVIGLFSYSNQPPAFKEDYHSLNIFPKQYLPISPNYSNSEIQNSKSPDFRNLIYWNPDVFTDSGKAEISFFTSDAVGKYSVVIQGIDVDGNPGYKQLMFEVVRD